MSSVEKMIQDQLWKMQDLTYRDFHCRLMPTVDPATVIGVRTPQLRDFAKQLAKTPESAQFLQILPHKYYEENNLHGFLIEQIKDYDDCIARLNVFLPYVNNWATCDMMRPKIFKKNLSQLIEQIKEWVQSDQTYTIRFGLEMLMCFYLDEQFCPAYLELVAKTKSREYYVNMMIAWYFATALAKQYDTVLPYICQRRLDVWVHNKAIQKAVESDRITPEQKVFLRTLKVK